MNGKRLFREYLNREDEPRGPDVLILQLLLKAWNPDETLEPDGEYGPITAAAVERLQTRLVFTGSDVDGNFGPNTRERVKSWYGIDINTIPSVLEYSLMKASVAPISFPTDPSY